MVNERITDTQSLKLLLMLSSVIYAITLQSPLYVRETETEKEHEIGILANG